MKLWHCTAEIELVIASDEQPDSLDIALLALDEACDNYPDGWCNGEITTLDKLPDGWREAYPRSDKRCDKTCSEILEENAAAAALAKEKQPLPGQMKLNLSE